MGDAAWSELWKTVGAVLVSFFALLAAMKAGKKANIPDNPQTVVLPSLPEQGVAVADAGKPPSSVDLTGYSPGLIEAIRTMSSTIEDMQDRQSEQHRLIGILQMEKADHEVIRLAFIEIVHWIDDGCPDPKPSIRLGIRRALGMVTD